MRPDQCRDFRGTRRACLQRALEGERFCAYHAVRRVLEDAGQVGRRDAYYEGKVRSRKVTPALVDFSEAETTSLLAGRYRGDGRRLDQWVVL